MLDQQVLEGLNEEFSNERNNAEVYEALASQLRVVNWAGAARWAEHAAKDERKHARILRDYIIARNETPVFTSIDTPPLITGDELSVYFQAALEREQATTLKITTLHMTAWNAVDIETCTFLLPMVEEQTRSTAEIQDILKQLSRTEVDPKLVDNELAEAE